MALDFSILDNKGVPLKYVPIGISLHQRLIELAERLDSSLIARMHDYYQDVNYLPFEISPLLQEIKAIRKATDNVYVIDLLMQLEQLCNEALEKELAVSAIAD